MWKRWKIGSARALPFPEQVSMRMFRPSSVTSQEWMLLQ